MTMSPKTENYLKKKKEQTTPEQKWSAVSLRFLASFIILWSKQNDLFLTAFFGCRPAATTFPMFLPDKDAVPPKGQVTN